MTHPDITRDTISEAAQRIQAYVRQTPVIEVNTPPGKVNLKLEFLQLSGTFKTRGAFNSLLCAPPGTTGVAAASGGNHGAAVACASQVLGLQADIFVPEVSPPAKRQAIERFGARMHVGGDYYAQAAAACQSFAAQAGALICHAYDMVHTLQGQGTTAREWQAQSPGLDTVLVAVGGGGLIGGMAAWYQDSVRLVAVESEGCPTLHSALQAHQPVDIDVGGLAADSLGAKRVGDLMFPFARQFVDQSVLVSDSAIRAAQRYAWDALRIALEPGGAAALAAWLDGAYQAAPEERVGILLCGANTTAPAQRQPAGHA